METLETRSNRTNDLSNRPTFKNLKTTRLVLGLAAILLLAATFMAGVSYQKSKHTAVTNTVATRSGGLGGFGGGRGQGASRRGGFGTVTAASGTSITIQTRNGSDATYAIASSTQITDNGASASASDIAVGDTVLVTPDTTVATQAARILLNPSFGGGLGGGASPGASTDSSGSTPTTDAPVQSN